MPRDGGNIKGPHPGGESTRPQKRPADAHLRPEPANRNTSFQSHSQGKLQPLGTRGKTALPNTRPHSDHADSCSPAGAAAPPGLVRP